MSAVIAVLRLLSPSTPVRCRPVADVRQCPETLDHGDPAAALTRIRQGHADTDLGAARRRWWRSWTT